MILTDEEQKAKGDDETDANNDQLLDYSHFDKITMALVDETQLSSLKERRKQADEENKGVGGREASKHVDSFIGMSTLSALNE